MLDQDPMVKITSLPTDLDIDAVLAEVSKDVSRDTGLGRKMVTYYWQTFDAIHCPGCRDAGIEGGITFIDLYLPGFMATDTIEKVMTSLAAALEKHAGIGRRSIFIYTHVARNLLFIKGEVVTDWGQIDGRAHDESSGEET